MEVIGRGCERVVVAIDSASLALSALEAAFVLAAGAHVPLAILFVVDLRLAVHPPATEPIPAAEASAQAAPTFPARAHADSWDAEPVTFRAQAQHVRRLALGMAQRFAVAWSMDTVRGELVPAALAALGPGDALVLHRGPLARFTLSEAAPLQALAGRPVLTLVDASAAVPRALRAAAAMARVIGSEL
ncbi:MAG TPA: hypothetical protein VFR86_11020, partial [Burkholderiaceae bacterium]|nr:hypothetical protein [Burkholderiaceae bacterium]